MVKILYGKGAIEFDEARYGASVIESRIGELKAEGDGRAIVRKAIENPIESPRLRVRRLGDHRETCLRRCGSCA